MDWGFDTSLEYSPSSWDDIGSYGDYWADTSSPVSVSDGGDYSLDWDNFGSGYAGFGDGTYLDTDSSFGGDAQNKGSSWSWGDLFNQQTLGAALSGGSKLYEMYTSKRANEDALKRSEEADKMKFLVELAKLQYGQKGGGGKGGGGGGGKSYLDLINAIEASKRGQSDAYQALMAGYGSAYG